MKKFIIICVLLFTASVGCKKMNVDGGGLCACSPISAPELFLVIKNNAGGDLLNEKTVGAYSKDKIQLFIKEQDGKIVPLAFNIRPPFSYGNEKFNFNQLHIPNISFLLKSATHTAYLKLGDGELYELNLQLNKDSYYIEKLLINKNEAEKDNGAVFKYAPIFYLTAPN